jgi:uncharacterized protein YodC (DUF2158 family)
MPAVHILQGTQVAKKNLFKTGDIVQLKSGGPRMTVQGYNTLAILNEGPRVECQWFAGAKLNSGFFDEDSLKPSSSDSDEE